MPIRVGAASTTREKLGDHMVASLLEIAHATDRQTEIILIHASAESQKQKQAV